MMRVAPCNSDFTGPCIAPEFWSSGDRLPKCSPWEDSTPTKAWVQHAISIFSAPRGIYEAEQRHPVRVFRVMAVVVAVSVAVVVTVSSPPSPGLVVVMSARSHTM